MAEVQDKIQDKVSGTSGSTALKAAAAAAATTAATYAVRKAFSHEDTGQGHESQSDGGSNGSSESKRRSGSSSILASAAATSWDAASDVLLPLADEAAEAAGKYVATHGPDVLRERIVPKFIEAFNEAK